MTKVTRRIGRDCRRLPEFEEHELGSGWPPLRRLTGFDVYQAPYWRAVDNWDGRESPEGGRINAYGFNCADCGGVHDLPFPKRALICPRLPDAEATTRAIGRIEGKIAKARGQHPKVSAAILEDIAEEIVYWAARYPSWGREIWAEYRHHPKLEEYIAAAEDTPLPEGDNTKLSPEQEKLIVEYMPLVRSRAKARSKGNDSLNSELEEVGWRVLEAEVRRFDPTLGNTFGAFVRQRVAGAMSNYISRERIRTVGGGGYDMALNGGAADVRDGEDATGGKRLRDDSARTSKAPKRHRSSTGGYKQRSYIEMSTRPVQQPDGVPTSRLISKRGVGEVMKAALAKLNPKQREVYIGRILTDPPISYEELARKLKIKSDPARQIRRILQQAQRKMNRLLKPKS
jgi:RNA polymerase sigma factor (sigma-70 family)